MLLREEAYGEELIASEELIGVAGQMDVDGDNGLCLSCVSPDGAEAAPGNGAGVELLRRARGRRRPPDCPKTSYFQGFSTSKHSFFAI